LPVYDALIIGASLAGTTAAIRLARQGFTVLLLDRELFPRRKICGEGLMPAGVGLLQEIGVQAGCIGQGARPFRGLHIFLPELNQTLSFADYLHQTGWITPRIALDARLVETAAAEPGVEFQHGAQLESVEPEPRQVVIRARKGRQISKYAGRLLIGADGLRSSVRRLVGIPSSFPARRRFALSACFSELRDAGPTVEIHCSTLGEAYVAPRSTGQVTVTLLLSSRPEGDFKGDAFHLYGKALQTFPLLRRRLPALPLGLVSSTAPLGVNVSRRHGDRLLLIGDAGGAVDPVAGQGMSLALRDAKLAGQTLQTLLPEDRLAKNDLAVYSKMRGEYFRVSADLANVLLFLLRHPGWAGQALRAVSTNARLRRKLSILASGAHPAPSLTWTDRLHLLLGR
jgi:menaquinone-9 beta-reductase